MRRALLLGLAAAGCVEGVAPATLDRDLLEARRGAAEADAGEPGADAAPAADAAPPPIGMCGGAASHVADAPCLACLEGDCCAPAEACFGGAACLVLMRCAAGCEDDAACLDGCVASAGDEALAAALFLRGCWARRCAAACAPAGADLNLVGALEGVRGAVAVDCTTGDHCANAACADCNGDGADFCEAGLRTATDCGACGRVCDCHPSGACEPEVVATGSATGLAVSAAGVAWLASSSAAPPWQGEVRWLPFGAAAPVVVARTFEPAEAGGVVLTESEVFFAGQRSLFRAPLRPAANEPPQGLLAVLGGRLLGAAGGFLYGAERRSDGASVWRWPLPAADDALNLCLSTGFNEGVVDAVDGTIYLDQGGGLVALPPNAAYGPACPQASPFPVASDTIGGVTADGGRVAWIAIEGAERPVRRLDAAGGEPREVGRAAPATLAGLPHPLLLLGDEVVFVDAAPIAGDDHRRHLVAVSSTGARRSLAVVGEAVVALRADATHVYWADVYEGVRRTPR